ncbi:ATP-dependent hsl protease ATP-binding subunit hslU [Syntrophobotulus glycolicus DSM 8271]|uniref:ATP-dependent protease ATPase subunit HslU n=1 Tax=Syntrophobotulus glycolicus (strain DSM 8271 / FlGlyR) TaxID=645991 RepID=F0SUB0_SYNGF|nr:ATP-dependent protease ATPase subunit HslU [Syntrophobotulus glycolicus]ADY56560.1 ATP-dependent hsl protease ATP-binding subunit hslU [Syntrophobotulus glycolicus DSM 8271]
MEQLTPREIVSELDKHIVGQREAKRAVAVALRNRYRRSLLPEAMQEDVLPKNILMIGPTGVGKTEIARRLAKLVRAPFIKVEATKFTEVGYVGRDVESIIRDLTEIALRMVKAEKMKEVEVQAEKNAEKRLISILVPSKKKESGSLNPFQYLFSQEQEQKEQEQPVTPELEKDRQLIAQKLQTGELEKHIVEVEVEESSSYADMLGGAGMELGINIQDMMSGMFPKKRKKRRVTVKEARRILAQEEAQNLIDHEDAVQEAIRRAEQEGIVFIDEIDKIAGRDGSGPDVSRGGVQRDILPLVEGSTVVTKYGPVKTDHVLFIAAGAFHVSKPSDLIPELQGRFPIRVELESLSVADFKNILTEPHFSLIKQSSALLQTEGINVKFSEDAIEELAEVAYDVNSTTENIGARRLHTIVEKVLEELSFEASELPEDYTVTINKDYVRKRINDVVQNQDLSKYIL